MTAAMMPPIGDAIVLFQNGALIVYEWSVDNLPLCRTISKLFAMLNPVYTCHVI